MMVLPVASQNGKDGKKKKGKKGQQNGGDVQVNLIVDPTMFGGRHHDEEDEEDEEEGEFNEWDDWAEDTSSMPGGYVPSSSNHSNRSQRPKPKKRRRPARRRNFMASLAMEEDWKRARAWLKKIAIIDGVGCVVWAAIFVYILIGKRCPAGGFNGWCTAYNTSTAAACLLCVSFGVTLFFDVKDLGTSKISPRTRT
jgi:hypothetical protein